MPKRRSSKILRTESFNRGGNTLLPARSATGTHTNRPEKEYPGHVPLHPAHQPGQAREEGRDQQEGMPRPIA